MSLIEQFSSELFQLALSLSMLLCFIVVSRKNTQRKNLEKKYEEALNAILFLLETESNHCKNNEVVSGNSLRNTMRSHTKMETNLTWNSSFSKSNCIEEINKIKNGKNVNNALFTELIKLFVLKVKG